MNENSGIYLISKARGKLCLQHSEWENDNKERNAS